MELGENAGQVSRGYTQQELDAIQKAVWGRGSTESESCLICLEQFDDAKVFKKLQCGHEYDAHCIDTWLLKEKRCPVCAQNAI